MSPRIRNPADGWRPIAILCADNGRAVGLTHSDCKQFERWLRDCMSPDEPTCYDFLSALSPSALPAPDLTRLAASLCPGSLRLQELHAWACMAHSLHHEAERVVISLICQGRDSSRLRCNYGELYEGIKLCTLHSTNDSTELPVSTSIVTGRFDGLTTATEYDGLLRPSVGEDSRGNRRCQA